MTKYLMVIARGQVWGCNYEGMIQGSFFVVMEAFCILKGVFFGIVELFWVLIVAVIT